MANLKDKTVFDLATRLNQIHIERQKLDMEYNAIVHELWDRIPSLKDDVNIQPRVLVKKKENKKDDRKS